MRVLIVGCGYIGLPLGRELARQGHKVAGVRRTLAAASELAAAGIEPLAADISVAAEVARLPRPWDWVVSCVASERGGLTEYQQVYLQGARNLVAWLRGSRPSKFVYTSSTGVYGQVDGAAVTEASPTQPVSPTSQVLVQTEGVLLAAAQHGLLPVVILRLAGIYGPGRGYWFNQFIRGEARIEGEGDRLLNMVHRDDVVGAIQATLARGRSGETYNVVDDEPVTQRALFAWLAEQLGRPLPPRAQEEAGLSSKRGLTSKRVLNAKLKTDLGYVFKYPSFREGYAAAIREWHETAS
jgi:nucleoside-diphosphate-sugar epimerase